MEDAVRQYLASTAPDQPAAIAWRTSCYTAGKDLVEFVERDHFPITGKDVLDVAAGWGGHILAFAERGARAVAAELNDHRFEQLSRFSADQRLDLKTVVANCERLPFADASFDVVLGLELIEHIDSVQSFANELARILKPGGVAILSTPPRLKSFFDGEPHYNLRYLSILPFGLQGLVAKKLLRRPYPFPITRQYLLASSALRPFRSAGLKGDVRWTGRLARKVAPIPLARTLGAELLFNFLVIRRV